MEVLREKFNPLIIFALGFLIGGLGLYFQIPYVLVLFLGILGVIFFYDKPLLALLTLVFAYVLVPDLLTLLMAYGIFGLYFFRKLTMREEIFEVQAQEVIPYVYFGLMIIATFTSSMVSGSIRDMAIHTAGLLTMVLILDIARKKEAFHKILVVLSLVTTILALYGIYQYFIGVEIQKEWVDVNSNADMRARVYSVFGNPNIFAEYLVMMVPLTVALFWSTKRDTVKIFYFILFGIQVLALFMTMSRGGWIGLAVAAMVFIFFVKRKLLLFAIPAGAFGFLLLPASIVARFFTIFNLSDSSTSYRFKIWEITGEVIRDNFFVGVGLGHQPFKYTFESYIRTMPIFHAHNSFIEIFAELGLVGFVLFCLFMISIFVVLLKYPLASSDTYERVVGASLIGSFSGMMVHGMFENIFYMTKITTSFWILLGLTYGLARMSKGRKIRELKEEVMTQDGKESAF